MASNPYFLTLRKALEAYYETGTWKVMLLNGHTENPDAHEFMNAIDADQVPATGNYTLGGPTIGTPTVTFDAGTNLFTVTFPAHTISNATITATHAVYYKELGANTVDEPALVNVFSGTFSSSNGDFTIPASSFQLNFPD